MQSYRDFGTSLAVPSGLAVDPPTGATFYTQAAPPAGWLPSPNGNTVTKVIIGIDGRLAYDVATGVGGSVTYDMYPASVQEPAVAPNPLAWSTFSPEPDPKLPRTNSSVWIVMVY